MSFVSTISSFAETVWFNCRRSVLRFRVRRYRRFAIFDEIRVGNDLVMTHQRRDLKFEDKVAEGEEKRERRSRKAADTTAEPKEFISGSSSATLGDLFKGLKLDLEAEEAAAEEAPKKKTTRKKKVEEPAE